MSKGILEFQLPEEQYEFKLAVDAGSYVNILHEIDQHLRAKIKYNSDYESQDKIATYQEIRTLLHNLLTESNLEI